MEIPKNTKKGRCAAYWLLGREPLHGFITAGTSRNAIMVTFDEMLQPSWDQWDHAAAKVDKLADRRPNGNIPSAFFNEFIDDQLLIRGLPSSHWWILPRRGSCTAHLTLTYHCVRVPGLRLPVETDPIFGPFCAHLHTKCSSSSHSRNLPACSHILSLAFARHSLLVSLRISRFVQTKDFDILNNVLDLPTLAVKGNGMESQRLKDKPDSFANRQERC